MLKFKSKKDILEYLEEFSPESLLADGYKDALVGVAENFYGTVAVYDKDMIIDKLKESMSFEDAEEFFSYNITGGYVGDLQPIYLVGLRK